MGSVDSVCLILFVRGFLNSLARAREKERGVSILRLIDCMFGFHENHYAHRELQLSLQFLIAPILKRMYLSSRAGARADACFAVNSDG